MLGIDGDIEEFALKPNTMSYQVDCICSTAALSVKERYIRLALKSMLVLLKFEIREVNLEDNTLGLLFMAFTGT